MTGAERRLDGPAAGGPDRADALEPRLRRRGLNARLSARAARTKGADYQIDARIPDSYLLGVAAERVLMGMRGAALFPRRSPRPFVGAGARFRARDNLQFGSGCTFGPGTFVDALAQSPVRLGDNVSLGRNTRIECTGSLRTIGRGLEVGNDVGLGSDCFYGCAGGIVIGADTIIGNLVTMHSENHRFARPDVPIRSQGVTHAGIRIGQDCWIGAKATILDGVELGSGSVIAAGSVVTAGTYEAGGVYAGAPARRVSSRPS